MRIAATADIHVREQDKGKWAPWFREVGHHADVLVICGDLTDTGDDNEAALLAKELKECTVPIIVVLGNHDYEKNRQKLIRQIMIDAGVHVLDGESVVIQNVGFAGVKGFGGGFDKYMLSKFGEAGWKALVQEAVDEALHLDRALSRLEGDFGNIKKIALMHYSPIKETIVGEPEVIFPFLGCSHLAEPLARRNVEAAFHGHAHAGILKGITSSGVNVFNVALPILHKEGFEKGFFIYEV